MEGPTPVSALIHAATMVTAGVYMCTRSAVIFTHAPVAMETVAIIGLATAVFAATIGLPQNDIKKVFAYSTVSQLGYMFLGVGVGAFSAGIWHLMTHAFFKALLFLGAGSVIHACHGEQDMRHMGGLRKYAPITFWTLVCASLAISGVPATSPASSARTRFWSPPISMRPGCYWVGVITAGMTAFYVWRAMFMTFFGEYRGHGHPHESPVSMWARSPSSRCFPSSAASSSTFRKFSNGMFPLAEEPENPMLLYVSIGVGLIGIALAYYMYVVNTGIAGAHRGLVQRPLHADLQQILRRRNLRRHGGPPAGHGSRTVLWHGVDQGVIDGIVNGVGTQSQGIGGVLKLLQSGNIRSYATWVVLGSVAC